MSTEFVQQQNDAVVPEYEDSNFDTPTEESGHEVDESTPDVQADESEIENTATDEPGDDEKEHTTDDSEDELTTDTDEECRAGQLQFEKLDEIVLDPERPQMSYSKKAVGKMQKSLLKGQKIPMSVKRVDGKWILVDGYLRWLALKANGEDVALCMVIADDDTVETALIINNVRYEMNPIALAEAALKVQTINKYTNKALGEILGYKESTISEILSLNGLHDDIKNQARSGAVKITRKALISIVKSTDADAQKQMFKAMVNQPSEEEMVQQKCLSYALKIKIMKQAIVEIKSDDIINAGDEVKSALEELATAIQDKLNGLRDHNPSPGEDLQAQTSEPNDGRTDEAA